MDAPDANELPQDAQPEAPPDLPKSQVEFFLRAAEKVRTQFPNTPGVYLFQDKLGRVIYIGKAKNLRARAGSYFLKAAAEDSRTAQLVLEAYDIDFMETESEVDALLKEARLVKDIQPKFNRDLRDDKTFPYLQITTHEDFPRVEITRTPQSSGVKLYGPFANVSSLRGALQVLQRVFKFRTCPLDIEESDDRWRWFRPCLLASIRQCTAPCNLRISKEEYRKDINRLRKFLDGGRKPLLAEMRAEMQEAAAARRFEQAAKLRDEIQMLESLEDRGDLEKNEQPEVFYLDPKKGLAGLQKVLKLDFQPRTIEGCDIAHLGGTETVASLVQFIDGLPFKPGYRRFRIREVQGIDDYASMHEVVARRFRRLEREGEVFPDILLIDGGKGQLGKALTAFETLGIKPPLVLSLAKKEELIYVMGRDEPLRLSRHAFALRLLQYVRDEAHRFAQHYHHLLRRKRTLGDS
ncbi:UvrB/UvrC motif-containing protein [Lacipirellula parvula]|uniref:Excinuclease ABC subunit C n=1 Tax=Lacipirellula parvula TaxID=2650471 RepID=A0A5K7XBI6_9BACT|nr:excinuclease ABC subunit UvrC [Lacipirellula parvula]BBO32211.1 excinuclease ABC subunit C [Lacipirellula parvula]